MEEFREQFRFLLYKIYKVISYQCFACFSDSVEGSFNIYSGSTAEVRTNVSGDKFTHNLRLGSDLSFVVLEFGVLCRINEILGRSTLIRNRKSIFRAE